MINQPNPANGYSSHKVVDTLIDMVTGRLDIVIGSWPDGAQVSKPMKKTTVSVKYPSWLPEYFDQIEQTLNEHPEWSGLPPHKPNDQCYFNMATKQWEDPRTLQDLKDAQWTAIKQARSQAEYAGFTWDGSTFDSDATSQRRITGAVTLAQLSTEFVIGWTLQDNSVRVLNQMDMLNVGMELGFHVAAQFTKAQALRVQIEAATTPAEVAALVW